MEYKRHVAYFFFYGSQGLEAESFPVCRVFSVNVADTGSQHVYAQVSNHLAFVGVSTFAHANNAVFLAADGADFCLQGHSLLAADPYKLFRLLHVLLNRIVGAVEHDGRESGLDTF